jgi:hypothetical protein
VGCKEDACNEDTDSCDNTPDDGLCDNGQYCDGSETCDPVNDCQPGMPVDCGDGVECTVDACNEDTDACDNVPSNGLCDNGQFCDGSETCDPVDDCQPGTPVDCSDGVGCTVDACNEDTDACDNVPSNGLCDNGEYCDGEETCDPVDDCQPGTDPCDDGVDCTFDYCDVVEEVCSHVPNDWLCDNGEYCDGTETCDPVEDCQPGTPLDCDDGVGCTVDACNEDTDACDNVPSNGLCDNGVFCDGSEICDPVSDCQPGSDPCPAECETCDAGIDECVWCILDLAPGDDGIGTADFGLFAPCFGFCYEPQDPCADSNFDGDPNNCVGTGDFGLFAGCFGFPCSECDSCYPEGLRASAGPSGGAAVQLVVVRAPTPEQVVEALPGSIRTVGIGQRFYLEIWVTRQDDSYDGLAAAYVDVSYDPRRLAVQEIVSGEFLSLFSSGVIDQAKGLAHTVGGCVPLGQASVGLDKWVRVATLHVQAEAAGQVTMTTGPARVPYGIAVFDQSGDLGPSQVDFGESRLSILDVAPGLKR